MDDFDLALPAVDRTGPRDQRGAGGQPLLDQGAGQMRSASSGLAAVVRTMRASRLDVGHRRSIRAQCTGARLDGVREFIELRTCRAAALRECSMDLAAGEPADAEKNDEQSDQVWHFGMEGDCGRRVYGGQYPAGSGGHCRLCEDAAGAASRAGGARSALSGREFCGRSGAVCWPGPALRRS